MYLYFLKKRAKCIFNENRCSKKDFVSHRKFGPASSSHDSAGLLRSRVFTPSRPTCILGSSSTVEQQSFYMLGMR
ncbi:unnamed protein product [Amoebophrya sp. A25]|nr:unnamed protein product [Amoebophrya sp. A25]|eukprot:GSA25T00005059001.1